MLGFFFEQIQNNEKIMLGVFLIVFLVNFADLSAQGTANQKPESRSLEVTVRDSKILDSEGNQLANELASKAYLSNVRKKYLETGYEISVVVVVDQKSTYQSVYQMLNAAAHSGIDELYLRSSS